MTTIEGGTPAVEQKSANITAGDLAALLKKPRATAPASAQSQRQVAEPTPKPSEPAAVADPANPDNEPPVVDPDDQPADVPTSEPSAEIPADPDAEPAAVPTEEPQLEPGDEPPAEPPSGEMPEELRATIDELKKAGKNGQAQLLKRVHKLADARDLERMGRLQAEQKAQELAQQLEQAKSNPGQATVSSGDRFAAVPEIKALDGRIGNADNIIDWAESALAEMQESGASETEVSDGKGGKVTYSAEQVRAYRKKAERERIQLNSDRSAQVALLKKDEAQARQHFNGQARQLYPWITKKDSPEYQEASGILRAIPQLAEMPGVEMIVGRYVEGMKAEKARTAAAGKKPAAAGILPAKAKPSNTPPPIVGRPDAGAPRVNKPQADATSANKAFQSSGKTSDLAKRFASNAQARRAA